MDELVFVRQPFKQKHHEACHAAAGSQRWMEMSRLVFNGTRADSGTILALRRAVVSFCDLPYGHHHRGPRARASDEEGT